MAFVDLRQLSEGSAVRQLETLVRVHARHPFDLSDGPVWRATLVRLGAEEHVVLWNQHHISSDRLVRRCLRARAVGAVFVYLRWSPVALAPLTIQYADFSQWQRGLVGRGWEKEQIAYWNSAWTGAPPVAGAVRPIGRVPLVRASRRRRVSGAAADLSKALTALGRQEGKATMYITLLTALNVLLYLHTGQTDIVVGSPTAGRSQGETEHLIGFFLNTLALRTR